MEIYINSHIKPYMNTLERAELTALIRHVAKFLISGIPIFNSEVRDTAGRKTIRRRTPAIANSLAFHANAKSEHCLITFFLPKARLYVLRLHGVLTFSSPPLVGISF